MGKNHEKIVTLSLLTKGQSGLFNYKDDENFNMA